MSGAKEGSSDWIDELRERLQALQEERLSDYPSPSIGAKLRLTEDPEMRRYVHYARARAQKAALDQIEMIRREVRKAEKQVLLERGERNHAQRNYERACADREQWRERALFATDMYRRVVATRGLLDPDLTGTLDYYGTVHALFPWAAPASVLTVAGSGGGRGGLRGGH